MDELGRKLLNVVVQHFDVGMIVFVNIVGDGVDVGGSFNTS